MSRDVNYCLTFLKCSPNLRYSLLLDGPVTQYDIAKTGCQLKGQSPSEPVQGSPATTLRAFLHGPPLRDMLEWSASRPSMLKVSWRVGALVIVVYSVWEVHRECKAKAAMDFDYLFIVSARSGLRRLALWVVRDARAMRHVTLAQQRQSP